MSRAGARFLKINCQNFPNVPRGSAIFFARFRWKINRRNFEDVSSESTIFEDTKMFKT